MIRRIARFVTSSIEKKILEEQNIVVQRFNKELEREKYEIDPIDKGSPLGEFGFRVKGPEPTRYGDWERKGRVSDF